MANKLMYIGLIFQLLLIPKTLAQWPFPTQSPAKTTSPPNISSTASTTQSTSEPVTSSESTSTPTITPENATTLSPDITPSTEPITTEPTPSTTAIPELIPNSVRMDYDLFCTCDLMAGQCDVNCCCDPDCGPDDHRLFNHCWLPPSSYFERHYCSPDPNRYGVVWNNTPEFRTEWNPHSGMFCIVTDNVPKRRMYEEKPPVTEEELFQHILPKLSNRWNDRPPTGMEKWIYQPFYKEGSPIFTLHINGTINVLKLPRSLNSASCNIAKTVGFLQSDSYECNLPGDRCNPTIDIEEWLTNLTVFRLPFYSTHSSGNSSVRWGDMEKLAPVVVRICETELECRTDIKAPKASCHNALEAVTLRIGFNGTEGIRFVLADLLYTTKGSGPVRFETTYHSLAERPGGNQLTRIKSGNPGYLKGKPIVTAKLNTSSTEGEFRSLRLFPRTTKSRLIRFGEDSYQTVQVNGFRVDNRTVWCSNWRKFILESFWGPDFSELRLGAFGNVELNETTPGFWIPIEIRSDLECLGSNIRAELVIIYTKTGSYDQPQNKLLGAGLQLRSLEEGPYCMESATCSLLLSQTVSFVMTDSPTFMILPQPPRWKIQLPRDFFYPFLLSSSCPGAAHVSLSLFVFNTLFVVVCFISFQ